MIHKFTFNQLFKLELQLSDVIGGIQYEINKGYYCEDEIGLMRDLVTLYSTVTLIIDGFDGSSFYKDSFDDLTNLKQQIICVEATVLYGDKDYDKIVELGVLDKECKVLLEKVKSTIRLRDQENKRGK